MSFLQPNFGNAQVLPRRGMPATYIPATQCRGRDNCPPSSSSFDSDFAAYEGVAGEGFGLVLRAGQGQRIARRKWRSWRLPAVMALLGTLALTAACGTSVRAPSGDGSQPSLVSENKAERVPDSKTYGNLHITRFIDSEGVFNPTPVAVRARRPGSTTAFVRDTPEPSAAVRGNVAEASPAG